MTSVAPTPNNIPNGMVHVGWRCTNPDHTCLRALTDTDPEGGPSPWEHNATWTAVFAYENEL